LSARVSPLRGVARHGLLSLELNFRSGQALVYGYVVPVIFLVAFAAVFRSEVPPLAGHMGQVLAITILGGACFGMPTSLVAEREQGIWRRYRLLPVPMAWLVAGVLAARVVIVVSATVLQVVLAHVIYNAALPAHPVQLLAGIIIVTSSFLGVGLVIAARADDVPAVQALGQCIFLPMVLIGGVGVPLAALPHWAQIVSGFMPGRYAVEVLQHCYAARDEMGAIGFALGALVVIGISGAAAGSLMFRWDAGSRAGRRAPGWTLVALFAWLAVGCVAAAQGRLEPAPAGDPGFAGMHNAQIEAIAFDGLPGDSEFVSRLAPPFRDRGQSEGVGPFVERLKAWSPAQGPDAGQASRNLLSVAGIADVSEDLHEGEIARAVYNDLRSRFGNDRLKQILAWVILYPDSGSVLTTAPELGLPREFTEKVIRERSVLYAKKFLGRLTGQIRE
jgi:ABC-type transport system involved in cytochrome c biogenesis permease component